MRWKNLPAAHGCACFSSLNSPTVLFLAILSWNSPAKIKLLNEKRMQKTLGEDKVWRSALQQAEERRKWGEAIRFRYRERKHSAQWTSFCESHDYLYIVEEEEVVRYQILRLANCSQLMGLLGCTIKIEWKKTFGHILNPLKSTESKLRSQSRL